MLISQKATVAEYRTISRLARSLFSSSSSCRRRFNFTIWMTTQTRKGAYTMLSIDKVWPSTDSGLLVPWMSQYLRHWNSMVFNINFNTIAHEHIYSIQATRVRWGIQVKRSITDIWNKRILWQKTKNNKLFYGSVTFLLINNQVNLQVSAMTRQYAPWAVEKRTEHTAVIYMLPVVVVRRHPLSQIHQGLYPMPSPSASFGEEHRLN